MKKDLILQDLHGFFDMLLDHPDKLTKEADLEEQIFLPACMGQGMIRRIRIQKGMEIIISDLTLEKNLKLNIKNSCSIFELNYCLSGENFCVWGEDRHIHVRKQTGNICYLNDAKVQLERQAGIRNHTLEIRMLPQTLYTYFPESQDRKVIEKVLQYHEGKIEPYSISPAIQKCAYEIAGCSYQGTAKRIYLQGKIMELLSMLLCEHISGYKPGNSRIYLSQYDIRKLYEAQQIVLNNLETPFSIKSLAHQVGINETKLKNGFRELFGTTIFGLVRSQRMDKAVQLMKTDKMNVSEIASILGYSNISNFAAAFRKKFGCNPSAYLNSIKADYELSK